MSSSVGIMNFPIYYGKIIQMFQTTNHIKPYRFWFSSFHQPSGVKSLEQGDVVVDHGDEGRAVSASASRNEGPVGLGGFSWEAWDFMGFLCDFMWITMRKPNVGGWKIPYLYAFSSYKHPFNYSSLAIFHYHVWLPEGTWFRIRAQNKARKPAKVKVEGATFFFWLPM